MDMNALTILVHCNFHNHNGIAHDIIKGKSLAEINDFLATKKLSSREKEMEQEQLGRDAKKVKAAETHLQ